MNVLLRRVAHRIRTALVHARIVSPQFAEQWRSRSREEVLKGFDNLDHPHRTWLMDRIAAHAGSIGSLIEIGSGYGPNLYHLARRFPAARLHGIDLNPISVREGDKFLRERNVSTVRLECGSAEDLSRFESAPVDAVLSDACLIYVAPKSIGAVLREARRAAVRYLFLLELHEAGGDGGGRYIEDGYLRDYVQAVRHALPGARCAVEKIPAEIFPGGRWPAYGHLIVVSLSEAPPAPPDGAETVKPKPSAEPGDPPR